MRPHRDAVAAAALDEHLDEKTENSLLRRIPWDKIGLPLALAIVFFIFSVTAPNFLTLINIVNVVRQVVTTALVAYGVTFAIVTGGIDLSVGSTMSLVSVTTSLVSIGPLGFSAGLAVGLLTGLLVGAINGLIISQTRVQPFIATLGMATAASGAALLLSNGDSIPRLPPGFSVIGFGYVLGVPVSALITVVVFVLVYILLHRSHFGRYCFAVGGNETAAYLSGVNVRQTKFLVYLLVGALVAVASIIATARTDSGQPTLGLFAPLPAIAAAVIGGASLGGGRGSIVGTTVGVFFMAFLYNGMNLLGISIYTQDVLVGIVILVAAGLDALRRRISG